MPGSAVLQALAGRQAVAQRVALVVAHPDDEAIALGGSLHLLRDLLMVHATDGAPRGTTKGFASRDAYAAARRAELAQA